MEDLEVVLQRKVKPIIESATKKAMGVSIAELNKSLLDTLEQPLLEFDTNDDLQYKAAKKIFKRQFISKVIQTHFGNISDVAKAVGMDRRSVHRMIQDLHINVSKLRGELLQPQHYQQIAAEHKLRNALAQYKNVIREEKLEGLYNYVHEMSGDILKELPLRQLSYKVAEQIWEKQYLRAVLLRNNWHITNTAKSIGLRYETLLRKMKQLHISE